MNNDRTQIKPDSKHYNYALTDLEKLEKNYEIDLRSFGPDFFGWNDRLISLNDASNDLRQYSKTEGDDRIIQAAASLLKENNYRLMITDSGSQALTLSILLAVQEKRVIGLPLPYFPGFVGIAKAFAAKIFYYDSLNEYNALEVIKDKCRQHKVCLIINSPNNPTGKKLSHHFLDQLQLLANDRDLTLLADHTYFWTEREANNANVGNIRVYSLGKALGLPGLRLGAIAVQNDLHMAALINLKRHMSLHSCPLAQRIALTIMFKHDINGLHKRWRKKLKFRMQELSGALDATDTGHTLGILGPFSLVYLNQDIQTLIQGVPSEVFGVRSGGVRICHAGNEVDWQNLISLIRAESGYG